MTTSCYCWSWRSLHRRTNAGIVWVSAPGDYALFNSNHIPDGTGATLDIVPTLYRFETIDQKAATGSWHWFFLIQGRGLPEHMIGGDPEFFCAICLALCCTTRTRSSRRRGPSTCAASTRRRSARPTTNTAPAHPSTWSTTA